VGARLTPHPELFGACVPQVGVFDMLRCHTFTVGWAWTGELGSPDDPDEYQWLRGYSPLHDVRSGTRYPPTRNRRHRSPGSGRAGADPSRSRPVRRATQPTAVPPSKPFGMAESFFSALNSSVAWVLFHSTESPAFV
jgi:hypothetical protein